MKPNPHLRAADRLRVLEARRIHIAQTRKWALEEEMQIERDIADARAEVSAGSRDQDGRANAPSSRPVDATSGADLSPAQEWSNAPKVEEVGPITRAEKAEARVGELEAEVLRLREERDQLLMHLADEIDGEAA